MAGTLFFEWKEDLSRLKRQAEKESEIDLRPQITAAMDQLVVDHPRKIAEPSCVITVLFMLKWIKAHYESYFQQAYFLAKDKYVLESIDRVHVSHQMMRAIGPALKVPHPAAKSFKEFMEDLNQLLDSHSGQ